MSTINYYLYYLSSLYSGYSLIIQITIVLVLTFSILFIYSFIRLTFTNRSINKNEKRNEDISKRFKSDLIDVLYHKDELDTHRVSRRLNAKDKYKKWELLKISQLLAEIIEEDKEKNNQELSKEFNVENYLNTITVFNLSDYWKNILLSRKADEKSLKILDKLGKIVPENVISANINTKDESMRRHAKSLFIKFTDYNTFKYLSNDFDKNFTAYDEIRIHDSLKEIAKTRPLPLLTRWLNNSKSEAYKLFLISEIAYFKQKESAPYLLKLYKEPDQSPQVKIRLASTLAELDYREAIPVIIEDFNYIHIPSMSYGPLINALGKFGGHDVVSFLEKLYHESHSKDIKFEIVKNLYKVDTNKVVYNFLKRHAETEFDKQIFSYVENDRVSHPIDDSDHSK